MPPERIGVLFDTVYRGGQRRLILPDATSVLIDGDLSDEMIKERFGVDVLRHALSHDWSEGVCVDGPLQGQRVWTPNDVGAVVQGRFGVYEVTRAAVDRDDVPELTWVEAAPPTRLFP